MNTLTSLIAWTLKNFITLVFLVASLVGDVRAARDRARWARLK